MRTTALIAVLVASLLATALASAAAAPVSVKACANKKSGALRLLTKGKCSRKERALSLSQTGPPGATGPQGAAGSPGAQGPQGPTGVEGPTGVPDTSNFFTKSESDARFVQPSGTVNNANTVGGIPARGLTLGLYRYGFGNSAPNAANEMSFGRLSVPAGQNAVLVGAGLGDVEVFCSDPAQTSIRYTHSGLLDQDVFIDDGGSNPVHQTVPIGGTMSAATLSGIGQLERLTIQAGFGTTDGSTAFGGVTTYVITAINAPGGDNRCLVQGQTIAQALGQ